jgi:hypothetical protein
MKNALALLNALVISTSAGCGEAPPPAAAQGPLGQPEALSGALPIITPRSPVRDRLTLTLLPALTPMPEIMTWTSEGDLAIVDGRTGAIKQLASTSRASGQPDLIYDPWAAEAVVFERDDEAETGEISSYPVALEPASAHLGGRSHKAWIDGEARLLAAPGGYVIFEASYGERWKVLFAAQGTTSSAVAPCPASAWVTPQSGPGFTVHAMSYDVNGTLSRHAMSVGADALTDPVTTAIGVVAADDPPTARMIPAPALGDALLFDVVGSDLAVRLVAGASAAPAALVPLGSAGLRVEHALGFDGGEVALLLLSGDSRVMAVEMSPQGAVKSSATLALPGVVREERRFFSHDLAALGSHAALAATSLGVFSIQMTRGGAGVGLALDPAFAGAALRGPIAAITPHSP